VGLPTALILTGPRLMLYIAKDILHDKLLAEDAVSQAFIKIIENLKKIDMNNCNKTKSYVVTIIRNTSFNILTQQKRMVMRDELIDISDVTETVLDKVTVNEAVAKIAEGIAGLNKNYTDILYLKLYMEYTNEEIAEILGISRDNVLVRYHRAINALKHKLQEEISL
jgi:RNA polymerase sigma-70 factor (ECF subfamily)